VPTPSADAEPLSESLSPFPDTRPWPWKVIYAVASFLDGLISRWPQASNRLTLWLNDRRRPR
jgi:hypothetical protein